MTADIRLSVLTVDSDTSYEVVGIVGSIREALEVAQGEFDDRLNAQIMGVSVMCPERYSVHSRGEAGDYVVAAEIDPTTWRVDMTGAR